MNVQQYLRAAAAVTGLFPILTALAAPGDLDAEFGTGGSVRGTRQGSFYAAAVQDDGRIVAVGNYIASGNSELNTVRYNPDGSLDNSFDGDGIATFTAVDITSTEGWSDVIVQPDGKIIVSTTATVRNNDFMLIRYNADGSLDDTFGQNGVVQFDLWTEIITDLTGDSADWVDAIAQQADGRIVVAGHYTRNGTDRRGILIRLNTNGSLDTSFGPFGEGYYLHYACSPWTYVGDIAIAPNGEIVIAGYCFQSAYDSYVLVVDADGMEQLDYATDASTGDFGYNDQLRAVAVQPDGDIVVGGFGTNNFVIARYTSAGAGTLALDTTFNTSGFVSTNTSGFDRGWGLALQPDGKLLQGGTGANAETTVLRFNPDGTPDMGFGLNGRAYIPGEQAYGVALQPDGGILTLGRDTVAGGTSVSRLEGGDPVDTDGDGLVDSIDPDDDNDGVPDELDDYPLGRFDDAGPLYWAFPYIETLARSGITGGCGGDNYCPEDSVTRAQMAVFLERGMKGSSYVPPPATGTVFADVAAIDFAAAFIEQLFADGITGGCGGGNYCPADEITRAQMAVFLLRALYGSGYAPPPASGSFDDVPIGHWAAAWIEQFANEGITSGCGGNNFCPDDAVTRAQMAVFLVRAFGL